jgi:hypothetical protein
VAAWKSLSEMDFQKLLPSTITYQGHLQKYWGHFGGRPGVWGEGPVLAGKSVGLARTIYIRCVYGIFGREITIYTVIYGVYIRFWPTLHIYAVNKRCFWQGNHQVYGHIRCVYTVLANPTKVSFNVRQQSLNSLGSRLSC